MYVVRVSSGKATEGMIMFRNSRPCAQCLRAMRTAGVKKVTYSTADGKFITEQIAFMVSNHLSNAQKLCIENGIKYKS